MKRVVRDNSDSGSRRDGSTAGALRDLLERVQRLEYEGARHLWQMPETSLVDAWRLATDDLARALPAGLRRRMADAADLSPEGLDAGLGVVARGVCTDAAWSLLRRTPPERPLAPALVVLASNLPGLALQSLLPALAARRPLLLKTPSAEGDFTPWMLGRLAAADSRLESAFAAATWRGGDRAVEDELLPRFERVVAYGGDGALADLGPRTGELVDHGHRISVGVVLTTAGLDVRTVARGLARDVALFDQRGCLSLHSVLVAGCDAVAAELAAELATALAGALRDELSRLADRLPPGRAEPGRLAAVRAVRDEAVMAGHRVLDLPLREGTVVVCSADAAAPAHLESPGLRTVRVLPVTSREALWALLEPWRGRLQGVALVAPDREAEERLRRLGVSRVVPAGRLQEVDAAVWRNGGRDPVATYAAAAPAE